MLVIECLSLRFHFHRSTEDEHTESSDLLSVLDQLNSDALSNGRVGLFGFDTDFFKHDTLGVRGATERR